MNKTIIICGPTACGKTQFGTKLAKMYNGEIISADSRQLYRFMDIGTGKDVDTGKEADYLNCEVNSQFYHLPAYQLDGVKVWLYDVISPEQEFSISTYHKLAELVIDRIREHDKLPLIVGGSGLYIRALTDNIDTGNIPPDHKLRTELENIPIDLLEELCRQQYPRIYNRLNPSDRKNPRRIIRKIEIAEFTKRHDTITNVKRLKPIVKGCLSIGLKAPNDMLYQRIDARVEARVQAGITEEISRLLARNYTWELPSMSAIGYSEWTEYFNTTGHTGSLKDADALKESVIVKWKHHEHAYARRQLTWFKKQSGIHWFDISEADWEHRAVNLVRKWYN